MSWPGWEDALARDAAARPRGPSGWAQLGGPKWVGPRRAQAGPKWVGPSWAQARNLGPKKIQKSKNLKIKIRSAQNVGNLFLSRKKTTSRPRLGPSRPIFCVGRKNPKTSKILPIFLVQWCHTWCLEHWLKRCNKPAVEALVELAAGNLCHPIEDCASYCSS